MPLRPLEPSSTGRVLDGQASFGRARVESGLFQGMVARSAAMIALGHLVERLAPVSRGSLIEGESGAGKSLLMAAVCRLGPGRGAPTLTLGADEAGMLARLQDAANGARTPLVCLVPELADITASAQPALVAALRAAEAMPLGVGLHVVAATSFRPARLRTQGCLRDDLYFHLTTARYRMPTLAERTADVPDLASALLKDICRTLGCEPMVLAGAALDVVAGRAWPGHVRELRNVLTRAVALNDSGVIGAQTMRLACALDSEPPAAGRRVGGDGGTFDLDARQRVTEALSATRGNKSEAAERLGMSRRSLYRLLERLDV